jgi:hypothetical protein
MERMGEALWPTEKLSAREIARRLALTQLLWEESERGWWRWCERPPERSSAEARETTVVEVLGG